MKIERVNKQQYYLDIAKIVLKRGTCIRRNYGAVIVKGDEIVSTGYTGSPRGETNCSDTGICIREKLNVPPGEKYELCKSVHAEMNACISAGRFRAIGGELYLVGLDMKTGEYIENPKPCDMCQRVIKNSGIMRVITIGS